MKNRQERKVVHNYHDYSTEEKANGTKIRTDKPAAEGGPESDVRAEQNFPVKLHYMLSELESDGMDEIVAWQPHGRCFVVYRKNKFVELILPLWFRQSKFSSFQRQLNLYGFTRITTGRDKGAYYHERFLRSKRFLSHRIERFMIKGEGARKPSSPETEPNFYQLPYLPLNKRAVRQIIHPMPHGAMMTGMNHFLGAGGPLSLHELVVSPSFAGGGVAALHQHRTTQLATAPVFNPGRIIPMEALKTQRHFPTAPMILQPQDVYMRSRKMLVKLPTHTVRRHGDNDAHAVAMDMFLSQQQQQQQQQQGRNNLTVTPFIPRVGRFY